MDPTMMAMMAQGMQLGNKKKLPNTFYNTMPSPSGSITPDFPKLGSGVPAKSGMGAISAMEMAPPLAGLGSMTNSPEFKNMIKKAIDKMKSREEAVTPPTSSPDFRQTEPRKGFGSLFNRK
jgi:hypothetical protein